MGGKLVVAVWITYFYGCDSRSLQGGWMRGEGRGGEGRGGEDWRKKDRRRRSCFFFSPDEDLQLSPPVGNSGTSRSLIFFTIF